MPVTRRTSRRNSNADSSTPTQPSPLKRQPLNQVNYGDKPQKSDPSFTEDSSSSEDAEYLHRNNLEAIKNRTPIKDSIPHDVLSIQQQNVLCSKNSKFKHILYVLIASGICIVPIIFYHTSIHLFNLNAGNDLIPNYFNPLNLTVMELIDEMENSFPLQKKDTWVSFVSALSSVIENEEPSQPAVLLFVGGNTLIATHTMQCVALTLANNTNKLLPAMISANDVSPEVIVQVDTFANLQNQEETIKKELDTRIRSILNKSYSVIVGPLEKIPPGAAFILHGYCDNFEAPFKKRVIILTATFDSDKPLNSRQLERRLHKLWDQKLGMEISASFVSRIANNVVFIEPETGSMPCTI
jgi:hypothetical protein